MLQEGHVVVVGYVEATVVSWEGVALSTSSSRSSISVLCFVL